MMTKWEYLIVKLEMPSDWPWGIERWEQMRIDHLKELNRLGQEGWEYIHSLGKLYYFKRPAEEIPPAIMVIYTDKAKQAQELANEIDKYLRRPVTTEPQTIDTGTEYKQVYDD